MATTADYLAALIEAKENLKENILQNGGTVSGTKLNQLAEDVTTISWGQTHYLTGSGTVNQTSDGYPSTFTVMTEFVPARICLNFSGALAGSFSDHINYTMIGRLVIPQIERNNGLPQTHTVQMYGGMGNLISATVTTKITANLNGGYQLTISLPNEPVTFVFRGPFDWLCVDADWEGDAEE